jgi:hypothetical protein
MRTLTSLVALAGMTVGIATGCAGYTRSKIDLAAQAQAGVALVRSEVDAQRGRTIAASDALRAKLDAAFDEDVASRGEPLDADWVITHRKAYALAVDAFDADRRAADAEGQLTLRTLDSINAALAQLQQMHAAELKLTLPELKLLEVTR